MKKYAAICALLFAPACLAGTIKLNDANTLSVSTDKNSITTVAIVYSGDLQESISIGNSTFDQSAVKSERLCQGCEKAYLIPIPDASSTYGAQTFVVVYPEGPFNWSMQKLPISADLVKPAPKSSYYLLDDGQNRYEFKQGLLIKVK